MPVFVRLSRGNNKENRKEAVRFPDVELNSQTAVMQHTKPNRASSHRWLGRSLPAPPPQATIFALATLLNFIVALAVAGQAFSVGGTRP